MRIIILEMPLAHNVNEVARFAIVASERVIYKNGIQLGAECRRKKKQCGHTLAYSGFIIEGESRPCK